MRRTHPPYPSTVASHLLNFGIVFLVHYRITMTSSATAESSTSSQSNKTVSGWPALPAMNDSKSIYDDIESKWLQHPCPAELGAIPMKIPSVVAQIAHESLSRELYSFADWVDEECRDQPQDVSSPDGKSVHPAKEIKNGTTVSIQKVDDQEVEKETNTPESNQLSFAAKTRGMGLFRPLAKHFIQGNGLVKSQPNRMMLTMQGMRGLHGDNAR